LLCGNYAFTKDFMVSALNRYPQDGRLRVDLAILLYKNGDSKDAEEVLSVPNDDEQLSQAVYEKVINHESFLINMPDIGKSIDIR
jgi:hypothetical protein